MRNATAKRLRRSAKKLSHSQSIFRKTYKHLKSIYKKYGNSDVVGYEQRKMKELREQEERERLEALEKLKEKKLVIPKVKKGKK